MAENANDIRIALQFIADHRITTSEWRKNGKTASGQPKTWTHLRMSGPDSSLTISSETQKALKDYTAVGALGHSIYALNDAGKKLLATLIQNGGQP